MVGMKLNGTAELARAISAMGDAFTKADLLDVLMEAGEPMREAIASHAKRGQIAPHIADHIVMSKANEIEGIRLNDRQAAIAIGPRKGFSYGWFLERGTVKMSAQPFVRPGFDAMVDATTRRIGDGMWRLIQRARGSSLPGSRGTL